MPPFPPSMRKELSEEGRQLLLDVMDPAASALSQAAPTRGADPHITIVVVDERFGNRLASLRYDRDSNTAYPPTLDEVVHDLTRLRGVPPDLVMLRSRGIGGRQLEPRGFGELLHAASASGAEALTLELSEDPSAAAGPVRIFSQGSYKAPGRARALVLYDARFATEHNLMTPLLTDVAEDRWAHDALQQVHITSSIVDYYGDGDMIPVLRLTVEFFNPEKLIAVSQAAVRSCGYGCGEKGLSVYNLVFMLTILPTSALAPERTLRCAPQAVGEAAAAETGAQPCLRRGGLACRKGRRDGGVRARY